MSIVDRISEEPPFRLLTYFLIKRFAKSIRSKNRWAAVDRPQYLAGVLAAADLARSSAIPEISVIEFGVAGGNGLVALESYAAAVEAETGVRIRVFGFDTGEGLPELCGDYRDHPDQWRVSDYKMDVERLRTRLNGRTSLVLGNIRDTVPQFVSAAHPPIGFIACDVDLYSSATDVLRILCEPGSRLLRRVFMYLDDVDFQFNHRYAGELLAIEEFNQRNPLIKIDLWRGLKKDKVFPTQPWLERMYIAHDLDAINKTTLARAASGGCALDARA
jgi:hypothetical protein